MNNSRKPLLLTALLVAIITLVVYLPGLKNNFVNWDDDLYIYDNPYIRAVNLKFLGWAFAHHSYAGGNWHPLTWFSHAMDYALWGLNPVGHHLPGILLHGINSFLVVLLAVKLFVAGKQPQDKFEQPSVPLSSMIIVGATTGLLFGIHPLHVESTAWVTERKDVLCGLFFLLSLSSYVKYAGLSRERAAQSMFVRLRERHYWTALGFFLLALLSKAMAVTLPVVFLILDWYPFQRFGDRIAAKKALYEKIPFFALSIAISVFTAMGQQAGDQVVTLAESSLMNRLIVSVGGIAFYLEKLMWPANLIPFYPYRDAFETSQVIIAFTLVAGLSAAVLFMLFAKKYLFPAAWLYFVITLLPVIGIVQVGGQAWADRYAYLPSIAPLFCAGITADYLFRKCDQKKLLVGVAVFVCLAFGFMTIRQISYWRDGETLWGREIDIKPGYGRGYVLRAEYYMHNGRNDEALEDLETAIRLFPGSPMPYYFRGKLLAINGLHKDALGDLNLAISMSRYADYLLFLERAETQREIGGYHQAIADYSTVLRENPDALEAYRGRGQAYLKVNRFAEALDDFTQVLDRSVVEHEDDRYNRDFAYAGLAREKNGAEKTK